MNGRTYRYIGTYLYVICTYDYGGSTWLYVMTAPTSKGYLHSCDEFSMMLFHPSQYVYRGITDSLLVASRVYKHTRSVFVQMYVVCR